jgi:hypothetical protein
MYLSPLRKIEYSDPQHLSSRRSKNMGAERFGMRVPRAAVAAVALAAFVQDAFAQTYTVNISPELNGLDVKVEPVSNPGMLVVNLTNNTAQKVRCDLNFQADPQMPYRTFVFMDAGKKGSAVLQASQKWYEVDVDVKCKPAEK